MKHSLVLTRVQRTAEDAELQELRARTRVMEAKRADDARHVRELETRLSEAESFVALRPKLQAKLNQLQTELIAARRELADAQQLAQLSDNRGIDAQEQLEMTMLDKEVAEEKAEIAQAELEEVKEKLAQMEVELQVLKDGGGKYACQLKYDNTDGEIAIGEEDEANAKSSLAYIQLEKHNERLKEALIRYVAYCRPPRLAFNPAQSPRHVTTNRTRTASAHCRDGEGHHEHR